ncbi:hypothetical protein [Methanocaldococcus sp.]
MMEVIVSYYPAILALLFGILMGSKFRGKIKHLLSYLVLALIIAYFLKAFPYYNLPISFSYVSAVVGIIIGNRLFGKKIYE